jgi:hypothetical protein
MCRRSPKSAPSAPRSGGAVVREYSMLLKASNFEAGASPSPDSRGSCPHMGIPKIEEIVRIGRAVALPKPASNLYRRGTRLPIYNGLPGRVVLLTARRAVRGQELGKSPKIQRNIDGFSIARASLV